MWGRFRLHKIGCKQLMRACVDLKWRAVITVRALTPGQVRERDFVSFFLLSCQVSWADSWLHDLAFWMHLSGRAVAMVHPSAQSGECGAELHRCSSAWGFGSCTSYACSQGTTHLLQLWVSDLFADTDSARYVSCIFCTTFSHTIWFFLPASVFWAWVALWSLPLYFLFLNFCFVHVCAGASVLVI